MTTDDENIEWPKLEVTRVDLHKQCREREKKLRQLLFEAQALAMLVIGLSKAPVNVSKAQEFLRKLSELD